MNDAERRDNMLEYLLILLNSAAAIGVGPQPGEIGKQYTVRKKSAGEMPGKQGIKKGWVFLYSPKGQNVANLSVCPYCVLFCSL